MTQVSMTEWGSLPAIELALANGARAVVTLYGAHLVSWRSADGAERIFCSAKSSRDGSRAIRGGVPVIFPQFAERGAGMRHGFARVCHWRLDSCADLGSSASARLVLSDADLPAALNAGWPHRFTLQLTVSLTAAGLRLELDVANNDSAPFAFAAALHSYYQVARLADMRVHGVQAGPLAIADKLDQMFFNVGPGFTLDGGASRLGMTHSGFTDAVVWNPGAQDAAALSDMADGEYQHFVCVEPALIGPHTLAAGANWQGQLALTAA